MNRLVKNFTVIIFTVVFLIGAAYVASKEGAADPYFQIENEYGKQKITIFDAQDTNWYVFLPSYSKMEQVQVILPGGQRFMLGDASLISHMTCEDFELETPYDLSADGEYLATLWFYQSRNVATMYIDTASGAMTDIHNDKNYEEYASMVLYTSDGSVDYRDTGSSLKGRGNSTWEQDKRPYLLKLSSDGDLLGMGSAKKWVLLANAYDETNLNNKLVYDLASRVGFDWSPDSVYVDLYLNGEYNGLYLLTEKIEIHPNRLDIDVTSGDFLCKVETWVRKESLQNYFESSMGRIIGVCEPKVLADGDLDYITYLVYSMEQELSLEEDLSDSEILDLDSWVRRYLIDEISGNADSDMTSSYFYCSNGKLFSGPIWDYDMAFGNTYRNQEPRSFLAKNENRREGFYALYYGALYKNESFYQRMVELYRSEFAPILQEMAEHGIDDQLDLIQNASRMNSIRWKAMFDEWKNTTVGRGIVQNSEDMKRYFTARVQFLNSAWLENKDYCTIQFETKPGRRFWNISVERGSCLHTTYMDLVNNVWLDKQTGVPIDFQKPMFKDLIVTLESEK